jgi:hypothetical protein
MIKAAAIPFLLCSIIMAARISVENAGHYDPASRSFIIAATYEIRPGDTMTVPSGAVLYFAPLTGIDVKGALEISGTPDNPVILASKKSFTAQGAPYDWRGIRVFPSAACRMSYASVLYASYGIASCCENITLINVTFSSNGMNIRIGERLLPVSDDRPFSFGEKQDPAQREAPRTPTALSYDDLAKKSYLPKRAYFIAPISLGFGIAGALCIGRWNRSTAEYHDYKPGNPDYDQSTYMERKEEFGRLRGETIANGVLGFGMAAAGLIGGAYITIYTLTF